MDQNGVELEAVLERGFPNVWDDFDGSIDEGYLFELCATSECLVFYFCDLIWDDD